MVRFQFANEAGAIPFMHIHIQSSYRLTHNGSIVLAAADMYQPKDGHLNDPNFEFGNFDWTIFGENRFDDVVQNKLLPCLDEFIVSTVQFSEYGDLKVGFADGYTMDVFLDTSGEEECWRFLNTKDAEIYLIVTGDGMEV